MAIILYIIGIQLAIIAIYAVYKDEDLKWWNYWIAWFWPILVPVIYVLYWYTIWYEKEYIHGRRKS